MKNNIKTRLMAALLCLVMIFAVSCGAQDPNSTTTPTTAPTTEPTTEPTTHPDTPSDDPDVPANGAERILPREMTLYMTADQSIQVVTSYYESTPDILLIDLESACENLLSDIRENITFEFEETDTTLTIKRSNGAYCVMDFVEDSIYFNDLDLFIANNGSDYANILASSYLNDEGKSFYFQVTDSTNIAGLPIYIDLASRGIPLDIYEDTKFIPLQTFVDIFLSPYSMNILYNTKDLFVAGGGQIDPNLEDEYYSIEATARSQALADFSYAELCLILDLYYGLQDEHGAIVGFDTYLEHVGLADDLRSTDAAKSSKALSDLAAGYLADGHTSLAKPSPYTGSAEVDRDVKIDATLMNSILFNRDIKKKRAEAMPDGVLAYQEIGNTAYITFDAFELDVIRLRDYSEAPELDEIVDTVGLIIYAHSMITRENSPIENVVLDLSCNGGGAFDAAVYVVSWMLGYCDVHFTNPVTNSFSTCTYKADVNLDGVFDENDNISNLNLYCITSLASFSCGNLVPALLKESGRVTLMGGTSGGGSCIIQHTTTADGCVLTMSSPSNLSTVANGAYYIIDRGVEPHIHFSKMESFFDREDLTEYLNGLK